MLLRRKIPVATIPIQTLEHAQQEPGRGDARVTVVYGAEVFEVHQQGPRFGTAVFRWNGRSHRAHGTVVGLAVGSRSRLLRDLYVKRRQVGKTVLPIRLVLVDEPGHDIVGRRARVRDLRLPAGFPLDGNAQLRVLHMGWEGGERGRTAMIIELPPGAEMLSDAERVRFTDAAKSFAGLKGATLSASEFNSTMTRSDRVFITNNVVLLGDGVQTTAPHVGMGMNIGVMQGRFFGNLWRDLTAARTPFARRQARARFAAAMRASRFGLHTYSKVFLKAYLPLEKPKAPRKQLNRPAAGSRRGGRSRVR